MHEPVANVVLGIFLLAGGLLALCSNTAARQDAVTIMIGTIAAMHVSVGNRYMGALVFLAFVAVTKQCLLARSGNTWQFLEEKQRLYGLDYLRGRGLFRVAYGALLGFCMADLLLDSNFQDLLNDEEAVPPVQSCLRFLFTILGAVTVWFLRARVMVAIAPIFGGFLIACGIVTLFPTESDQEAVMLSNLLGPWRLANLFIQLAIAIVGVSVATYYYASRDFEAELRDKIKDLENKEPPLIPLHLFSSRLKARCMAVLAIVAGNGIGIFALCPLVTHKHHVMENLIDMVSRHIWFCLTAPSALYIVLGLLFRSDDVAAEIEHVDELTVNHMAEKKQLLIRMKRDLVELKNRELVVELKPEDKTDAALTECQGLLDGYAYRGHKLTISPDHNGLARV